MAISISSALADDIEMNEITMNKKRFISFVELLHDNFLSVVDEHTLLGGLVIEFDALQTVPTLTASGVERDETNDCGLVEGSRNSVIDIVHLLSGGGYNLTFTLDGETDTTVISICHAEEEESIFVCLSQTKCFGSGYGHQLVAFFQFETIYLSDDAH